MPCESNSYPYTIREVAGVLYICYLPTGKKLLAISNKSEKGREIAYDFVTKMNAKAKEKEV